MLELRHNSFHVRADLLRGPRLRRHMLHAEIDELLGTLVLEFAAGVAPFAVFLVERAVRLMARYGVLERHAAALADVLARRAEKRVDGYVKERGQALERFRVGERFAILPAGHCLPGNEKLLRKFLLRQLIPVPKLQNHIFCFHIPITSWKIIPEAAAIGKQRAVASAWRWNPAAEVFRYDVTSLPDLS